MAGLQDDLASVFAEIGTLVEIVGSSPVVREYIDVEYNVQVSNPFIREHFVEGTFKAETKIQPGSLLNFVGKNLTYLVVNHSPELFEDLVVIVSATLYKCNAVVTVLRQTAEDRDPVTRKIEIVWEEVFTSPAPITSALRGSPSDLNDYQAFLQFQTKEKTTYFPESLAPKVLDRVRLANGDYFKILDLFDRIIVTTMSDYKY